MSSLPAYLKTWNFTGLNQSVPYVSVNDEMAELLYRIKNYCVSTLGATVTYSCDGTTGPASGADHTDRWASKANATTRGANTTTANSFVVFPWGTGQLCLSYVGASDDIARISFSPGGLFTPAGTANQTPTATDEIILLAAVSLVGNGTSANRVFHITGDTARTVLRVAVWRQNTLVISFGCERVLEAPGIPVGTMVIWSSNTSASVATAAGSQIGSAAGTSTGAANEMKCYLNGAVRICFGGAVIFNNSTTFSNNPPLLNGGVIPMPVLVGTTSANNDGWIGTRYDIIHPHTGSIASGNTFDDIPQGLRMMAVSGWTAVPWDPAQGMLMT